MTATAVKLEKTQAEKALSAQAALLNDVTKRLAQKNSENGKVSVSKMDKTQHVFYQLAWMTAQQRVAENFIVYAWDSSKGTGELEQSMALTFAAETVSSIRSELAARPAEYELTYQELFSKLFSDEINNFVEQASKMENYTEIVDKIVDLGHFVHMVCLKITKISEEFLKTSLKT